MEHIILKNFDDSIEEVSKKICNYILNDKLVIMPFDTAYGIAANSMNEECIDKIFQFKGRKYSEAIPIVIKNINSVMKYTYIKDEQLKILEQFLPGPVTFVLPKKNNIPDILTGGLNTVAIRIPNTPLISKISNYIDIPYTATSANYSGNSTIYKAQDLISQIGMETLKKHCHCLIEHDKGLLRKTSTIVDIQNVRNPIIYREGAVDSLDILKKIKEII